MITQRALITAGIFIVVVTVALLLYKPWAACRDQEATPQERTVTKDPLIDHDSVELKEIPVPWVEREVLVFNPYNKDTIYYRRFLGTVTYNRSIKAWVINRDLEESDMVPNQPYLSQTKVYEVLMGEVLEHNLVIIKTLDQ